MNIWKHCQYAVYILLVASIIFGTLAYGVAAYAESNENLNTHIRIEEGESSVDETQGDSIPSSSREALDDSIPSSGGEAQEDTVPTSGGETQEDSASTEGETGDASVSEKELSKSQTDTNFTYDPQPSTMEEVQAAIDAYENEYQAAVESQREIDALNIEKPRWEFEVPNEYMPEGYYCDIVTVDDQDTGYMSLLDALPYYTFFDDVTKSRAALLGTTYIINNAEDLKSFAQKVNNGDSEYVTAYVELGNNIDLSGISNWEGIGTTENPFKGNFDGKDFTIKGLKISSRSWYRGVFGVISGAEVKNVKLELSGNLTVGSYSGAFIGHAVSQAKIINCHVNGNGYTIGSRTGDMYVGGFVGEINDESRLVANDTVYFDNCSVTNMTIIAKGGTGGFAALLRNTNLDGCYTVKITINTGSWGGGFAGNIYDSSVVTNCYTISPNVTGSDQQGISGGFSAVIDKGSSVTGCYAIDPQVKSTGYAGGFSSLVKNGTVTNCYCAGGKAISTKVNCAGGFVGVADENAKIINCYAQTDVECLDNSPGVAGGFVGRIGMTSTSEAVAITNCYATGAVKGKSKIGGFAGWTEETKSRITNCYATGKVTASGTLIGGFIGYRDTNTSISNCFYDTTTTQMSEPYGDGGRTTQVKSISTTNAINYGYFSTNLASWKIKQNLLGMAGGEGTESSPWYIDDGITYPYFYYQYEGHSKEDTNYNLAYVKYQDGADLGQKYSDFTIQTTANSLPFKVKSSGAAKVYFPHSGISRYDINQSTDINVSIKPVKGKLYSLGSVSRTNIIAFDNTPYVVKTSNRLDSKDKSKNTWVGDVVTYTIKAHNNSKQATWTGVIIEDTLAKGITLVDGSLKLYVSNDTADDESSYRPINVTYGNGTPSENEAYYTYEYNDQNEQYQLKIYLPDFKRSTADGIDKYKIEFNALVGKTAATDFTAVGWKGFNNIRNTGTATGTLEFANVNTKSQVKVPFDDENTNPVYDTQVFVHTDADTGEMLSGAKFVLYKGTLVTGNGTDYENDYTYAIKDTDNGGHITDSSGIMHLKLDDGVYKLKEEKACSDYYQTTQGAWYITVTDGLITRISTVKAGSEDTTTLGIVEVTDNTGILGEVNYRYYVVKNIKKLGSITITKQNDAGITLPGAQFLLELWVVDTDNPNGHYVKLSKDINGVWVKDGTITASGTTDDTGTLVFNSLQQAKYRITEMVQPGEEQSLPKKAIEVNVPYGVTYKEENQAAFEESDFYEKNEETGEYIYRYLNINFTIKDTFEFKLPNTGGVPGRLAAYCAGGLFVLAAAGLYMWKRKSSWLRE